MNEKSFTPAQQDAINKAWEILTEHFGGAILGVTTVIEVDGRESDCTQFFWHGGFCQAIGMFQLGGERCRDSPSVDHEPE